MIDFLLLLTSVHCVVSIIFSFSPGNIWTPLWNKCANKTGDPEGMIEMGKHLQVLVFLYLVISYLCKPVHHYLLLYNFVFSISPESTSGSLLLIYAAFHFKIPINSNRTHILIGIVKTINVLWYMYSLKAFH